MAQKRGKWADWEKEVIQRFLSRLEEQVERATAAYADIGERTNAARSVGGIQWWANVQSVINWARSQVE